MPLELPRVGRCCFCLPLRTGSLLIGYLSVLISCLGMSAVSYTLYRVVRYLRDGHPNPKITPEEMAKAALGLYISHAYYLLVLMYLLIISLLLIVGVHMNKPRFLMYYFTTGLFLLALALALVVVSFVFGGLLVTLPLLKWCLIHFYCLLVVRSTHLEMEEENKPTIYQMHNIIYNPHQTQPLMA